MMLHSTPISGVELCGEFNQIATRTVGNYSYRSLRYHQPENYPKNIFTLRHREYGQWLGDNGGTRLM